MENNLENKVKFFAQYFGQEVAKCNTGPSNICHIQHYTLGMGNPQRFHLELKPLSSITDDLKEKIELIEDIEDPENPDSYFHYGKTYEECYYVNGGFKRFMLLDTYQYLQSKGYALPWMGLSVETLVEYGWIKLKEN